MKRIKKGLAVLLSVLMLLGAFAGLNVIFAEGEPELEWIPVKASAEDCANGDAYVDWSALDGGISADMRAELESAQISIAYWADYVEPDILNLPDSFSLNDLSYYVRLVLPGGETKIYNSPEAPKQCPLMSAIVQYESQWTPIATSTAGLNIGDWYIDFAAMRVDLIAELMEEGASRSQAETAVNDFITKLNEHETFYINPTNSEKHVKVRFTTPGVVTLTLYYPLHGKVAYEKYKKYVKQYDGTASDPGSGSGSSNGFSGLFSRIERLFQKLMFYLRNFFSQRLGIGGFGVGRA